MVQFRRLDPLANASQYQRLIKSPVKSFTLTEAQFDRIKAEREALVVIDRDAAVVGFPYRDFLEVHYAYPDVESFRDHFVEMFNQCTAASSRQEAPRGVVLSFRDRPNRSLANTVFWSIALDEGAQWVELNRVAVPEQPEPDDAIAEGFRVREATDADAAAIRSVEAEASGLPPLSDSGLRSLFEQSRRLQIVTDASGEVAGFVALRSEPGGWGVVDHVALAPSAAGALREPLQRWASAWLRNNGGRRQRRRLYMDQTEELALLRSMGFTAGETGLDYTRPVDRAEVESMIDERQAHGTLIKFGDWR